MFSFVFIEITTCRENYALITDLGCMMSLKKKSRDFRVSSSSDIQEPHDLREVPSFLWIAVTSDDTLVSTCPMYGPGLFWIQGLHREAMSQC